MCPVALNVPQFCLLLSPADVSSSLADRHRRTTWATRALGLDDPARRRAHAQTHPPRGSELPYGAADTDNVTGAEHTVSRADVDEWDGV